MTQFEKIIQERFKNYPHAKAICEMSKVCEECPVERRCNGNNDEEVEKWLTSERGDEE